MWSKHQERLFTTSAATWPQSNPSPFGTGHGMVQSSQRVSGLPGTSCLWCGIPPSNHWTKLHSSNFNSLQEGGVQSPLGSLCSSWWHIPTPPWPRETPRPLAPPKIRVVAHWFLHYRASCIHISQVHLCHLHLPIAIEFLSHHSDHPPGSKNSVRSWATPTGTTGSTRNNQGKHKPLPQELDLDLWLQVLGWHLSTPSVSPTPQLQKWANIIVKKFRLQVTVPKCSLCQSVECCTLRGAGAGAWRKDIACFCCTP